jgi:hypothetical protein
MVSEFYTANEEDVTELPTHTPGGEMYFHDLDNKQLENGNYVWRYVCHLEIEPEWNKRSELDFKGNDNAEQDLEYTLFRYMTSRGLRKDKDGLAQMSDEEIHAVENGVANVRFLETGISSRIYGIIWQLDDYSHQGAPGGHSLVQRWEFWKTGMNLAMANPMIGVGTGDVYNEMLNQYEMDGSDLDKANRKHPHNQYLSIALGFGAIGLMWFLFAFLYPVFSQRFSLDYVTVVFVAIALISMITEDTLETQAGVSFVAFFYSVLLFRK